MAKKQIEDINNFDDFVKMLIFVAKRIYSTPSMVDKLPKYIMDRVDKAINWYSKNVKD